MVASHDPGCFPRIDYRSAEKYRQECLAQREGEGVMTIVQKVKEVVQFVLCSVVVFAIIVLMFSFGN
jgi:hypothetical protein